MSVVTFKPALLLSVLAVTFITPNVLAENAFPSTYKAIPSDNILIQNATILTGTGSRLEASDILLQEGKIVAIGQNLSSDTATKIDADGRWVTPGLIDVHSHLGVYASPGLTAHSDGNEMVAPATPNVWAEHALWPQDPGFSRALAGGVTSMQILPGSANLFGGRGVTVKNVYANSYQAMKFPNAPHGLKMACGENPKRVYGDKKQAPMTRMGNVAGYRQNWAQAKEYQQSLDDYAALIEKGGDAAEKAKQPKRDLKLETLVGVLRGEIKVHMHCYRADEMLTILDLAKEFDYKISTFHHGVEAYKIADELAEAGVCGALWADWWGFKAEAYDGIQENIAMVDRPEGSCAIVHSDSSEGIQRLNQEAAKAMSRGNRAGMEIAPERAIQWLTSNPAKSLGIDAQTGSLVVGKMADVVIWNQNPFSVYAHAEQVYIDGALLYDRNNPELQPVSDFELGQLLGEKK